MPAVNVIPVPAVIVIPVLDTGIQATQSGLDYRVKPDNDTTVKTANDII